MNINEATENFTERIKTAVQTWAEAKLEQLCADRPRLRISAPYVKRGLANFLDRKSDGIRAAVDNLALFVADKDGNIDTDALITDALSIFREAEPTETTLGAFGIEYGKGNISIAIPHNMLFDFLFGDLGKITITADDLAEIQALLR